MTSMPASLSALATTLAPRSCPSRPGLATRTRIRSCVGGVKSFSRAELEQRRFAIGAEHVLQRRHLLSDRRVGARAFQHRLLQVAGAACGIAQLRERAPGARRVAIAAQLGESRALLVLDALLDDEQRNVDLVVGLDEIVDADHHLALRLERLLIGVGSAADLALLEHGLERRYHAALLGDLDRKSVVEE